MAQTGHTWSHKHLLGIAELSPGDIRCVLELARELEPVSTRSDQKRTDLLGRVVVNLFFEASTRTRCSFTLAAQRLSADVLDFSASTSSSTKGESLLDTARTVEAMGIDLLVCRHGASGPAHRLAESMGCSVINAGDGQHEHPTQGLLDLYTLCKSLGKTSSAARAFDLSGVTVAIVGDIAHSRVARSDLIALKKLGAEVLLVGPPTLLPASFEELGCEVHHDFDAVLGRVHAVNMLRVQFERMGGQAFPSAREYTGMYGLTRERLARMRKDVVVMHPGPMNRGLEIDSQVADGPNSVILQQVTHGLAVRMACMSLLINSATTRLASPNA